MGQLSTMGDFYVLALDREDLKAGQRMMRLNSTGKLGSRIFNMYVMGGAKIIPISESEFDTALQVEK